MTVSQLAIFWLMFVAQLVDQTEILMVVKSYYIYEKISRFIIYTRKYPVLLYIRENIPFYYIYEKISRFLLRENIPFYFIATEIQPIEVFYVELSLRNERTWYVVLIIHEKKKHDRQSLGNIRKLMNWFD